MSLQLATPIAPAKSSNDQLCALRQLMENIENAVNLSTIEEKVATVRESLARAVKENPGFLPDRFTRINDEQYARRPLYIDPLGRYSVVVMTWAPGQRTKLHDHGGLWIVECLYEGRMKVTNFDYMGEKHGVHQFLPLNTYRPVPGQSGCRVPPDEHHILENDSENPAITIHVFGGLLQTCSIFEPIEGGYMSRTQKLAYTMD